MDRTDGQSISRSTPLPPFDGRSPPYNGRIEAFEQTIFHSVCGVVKGLWKIRQTLEASFFSLSIDIVFPRTAPFFMPSSKLDTIFFLTAIWGNRVSEDHFSSPGRGGRRRQKWRKEGDGKAFSNKNCSCEWGGGEKTLKE